MALNPPPKTERPRDPTYADGQAIETLSRAADQLRTVIIRNIAAGAARDHNLALLTVLVENASRAMLV